MNTTLDRAFSTMRTLDHYTIVLRPDTNGTFIAYVPAIVGCHAWAETAQTAREELNHVFAMLCEEYLAAGRSLPQDVELVVAHAS
jgi:predicted RNase H-like HicB family nuclease